MKETKPDAQMLGTAVTAVLQVPEHSALAKGHGIAASNVNDVTGKKDTRRSALRDAKRMPWDGS